MVRIHTCPKCGSDKIELDATMGITGVKYSCKHCGYSGDIVVERDVEKK